VWGYAETSKPELHGGQFLKNSKTAFECSKKIRTKNLDLDHYEIYQCEKNQSKAPCILGATEKTNLQKFQTLKLYYVHYT
jgi:hypothetical protein